MVTNTRANDTSAPCKSITLPCTFRNENPIVSNSFLDTSILSCCATTEPNIKYPKLLELILFTIDDSPLTPKGL